MLAWPAGLDREVHLTHTPMFVTAASLLREPKVATGEKPASLRTPAAKRTRDILTMDDAELAAKRQEEDAEVALGQQRVDERRAQHRRERMAEDDAREAMLS